MFSPLTGKIQFPWKICHLFSLPETLISVSQWKKCWGSKMQYKWLGYVLNPTCVVIRMSETAGGWWQMESCGSVGGTAGKAGEIIWTQNGDSDTVFCHQAQVISCKKKSTFFDSVSMSLTSSMKFRWWPK